MQLTFSYIEIEVNYLSDETQLPRSEIEDSTWIDRRLLFWIWSAVRMRQRDVISVMEHVLATARENISPLALK
jgi:hypothetical protein